MMNAILNEWNGVYDDERDVEEETEGHYRVLSPRERQTIRLLAKGFNRKQAAAELNISESTLRTYIDQAIMKLRARNVNNAIYLASINDEISCSI